MDRIRIGIVEDHHLTRSALVSQLSGEDDLRLVFVLEHGASLPAALRRAPADVLLLDLGMEGGAFDPVSMMERLRGIYPSLRVIVVSSLSFGETALGVLQSGVSGYLVKDDMMTLDLPQVVRRVFAGQPYFSPRIDDLRALLTEKRRDGPLFSREERRMLALAARGHTNRQIGYLLGYSEKTVRNRFTPIFRKLGAANRVEAILKARDLGLLAVEPVGPEG